MKFSDYILLAYTKVRTRKIRSLLTMFAASVLVVFLMVGSFTYTGIRNSIENAAPPGLVGRHISIEDAFVYRASLSDVLTGEAFEGLPGEHTTDEEYRLKTREYSPTAMHTHLNVTGDFWNSSATEDCSAEALRSFSDGSSGSLSAGACIGAAVRSDVLFDYFTDEAYKFSDYTSDSVPVLLSNQYALALADESYEENDSPEDKIAKVSRARSEILGHQIEVAYRLFSTETVPLDQDRLFQDEGIDVGGEQSALEESKKAIVRVSVVGFVPDGSVIKELAGVTSFSADSAGILFPASHAPQELTRQVETEQPGQFLRLTEFASVNDLSRYVDAGCQGDECWNGSSSKTEHSYFTDYGRAVERTFAQAWSFLRWVVMIWGVGVGLSIMSTTAKVIVDSRKEIGVFRAIGAKRSQIFGIYATYVTMLSLFAAVLSFGIARLISNFQNSKWAGDISVQIALLNGSTEPRGHFSFFGFNPQHMLAIVAFVVAVALLGSAIPVMRNLRKDPLRYLRDD